MSSKALSRRGNSRSKSNFNRGDFDIVVDIPDTEGLDRDVASLEDLDIVCSIDDEDVFSHTYEEREKKMRVSIMQQDSFLRFRFIDS